MCTVSQLSVISKQMAECYQLIYGTDVSGVFLYGSYARGDNDVHSDIDIVAIVRGNRLELQQKLKKVWDRAADIGMENDVVVSPTVIPSDEFEKYKDTLPYYRNILREGNGLDDLSKYRLENVEIVVTMMISLLCHNRMPRNNIRMQRTSAKQ